MAVPSILTRQQPQRGAGLHNNLVKGLFVGGVVLVLLVAFLGRSSRTKPVTVRAEETPLLGESPDALPKLPKSYGEIKSAVVAPKSTETIPPPPTTAAFVPQRTGEHRRSEQNGKARPQKGGLSFGSTVADTESRLQNQQPKLPPVSLMPQQPNMPSGVEQVAALEKGTGHKNFLQQASDLQPTQVQDRLHTPPSPDVVLAGTIIPASLETGINSQLPGILKARVRQPIFDTVSGSRLLIPQNTVLIGRYDSQVVYGENRVLVIWQRMIYPNGNSIQLEGMPGVDLAGYSGLKDRVDNHLLPLVGAVLMSSVLSVGSRVPFGSTAGYQQTLPQEFAQDFGQQANQAGQKIVERELNRAPTITIRPGFAFDVMVHRDLVLQPWRE